MPRYKSDFRSASKESYTKFCQENPSVNISFEQFVQVIYTYNDLFMNTILTTGHKVAFPRGLGYLSINRKKTQTSFKDHVILPINWQESKKQGKLVHYFNDHTDGYRFKWLWFKDSTTNMRMKDIWCFKPARKWSIALRDFVMQPGKKFYLFTEWQLGRQNKRTNA